MTSGGSSVIRGCDSGPLCIVFDATSAAGSPALVSFIGGRQQLQYSKLEVSFGDWERDFLMTFPSKLSLNICLKQPTTNHIYTVIEEISELDLYTF